VIFLLIIVSCCCVPACLPVYDTTHAYTHTDTLITIIYTNSSNNVLSYMENYTKETLGLLTMYIHSLVYISCQTTLPSLPQREAQKVRLVGLWHHRILQILQ